MVNCIVSICIAVIFSVGSSVLYSVEAADCPSCSGDVVTIQDVIFPAGADCECVGTTSITAGHNVVIKKDAVVIFKAPVINLRPGFHVEAGGFFQTIRESTHIVFAWNDLGMHCLNPTYNSAVILPPYNTLWATVVQKAGKPVIVTRNLAAAYALVGNTYSYGKLSYGQFWDNAEPLFGTALVRDTGLNLADPEIHNALSGLMLNKTDHFQVDGIPVVPVNDLLVWSPYQVAEVTVRDLAGSLVARTRATIPTSDDINCGKCHGSDAFNDVLSKHDTRHATTLIVQKPVLCAKCHGSPALGSSSEGSSGIYLSQAIHGSHAGRNASCYDCHPGQTNQCNRSIAHSSPDGNCTTCHGTMAQVALSIENKTRLPWVNEPKCITCHAGVAEVDTGDTLYRNAKGHGNLYCAACHGSPHAMVPTTQSSDNYQAIQYQGKAKSIGSCGACHESSKGELDELDEFAQKHGGTNPEKLNTCHLCHTTLLSDTTKWPHRFEWKNR
ncbi:MAG: hypothetical protein V1793_08780 [Pseudomonadota bacterium]